jgi:hypothetical protein
VRRRRGWTAAQLAARCAEAGAPEITSQVVANIETGRKGADDRRRRDVTVDELLILAWALGIPPDFLWLPLDGRDELEVTPAARLGALEAAGWAAGQRDAWKPVGPDGSDRDRAAAWWRATRPMDALRLLYARLRILDGAADAGRAAGLADLLAGPEGEAQLREIARLAGWLAGLGLTPPPLPAAVTAALRDRGEPLDYPAELLDGERS